MNPGFWKYIIAPGALYLLERLFRIWRAHEKVVILSCTVMDDVFSLEFAKEGVFAAPYAEGQYIFLNSPAISAVQWHPFTISSAPQEKTVTVHIRVSVEGSWTKELYAYIAAMGPKGRPYFALDRQGPQGKLAGKILGPDGKPMLCIDGPHSGENKTWLVRCCWLCWLARLRWHFFFFFFADAHALSLPGGKDAGLHLSMVRPFADTSLFSCSDTSLFFCSVLLCAPRSLPLPPALAQHPRST